MLGGSLTIRTKTIQKNEPVTVSLTLDSDVESWEVATMDRAKVAGILAGVYFLGSALFCVLGFFLLGEKWTWWEFASMAGAMTALWTALYFLPGIRILANEEVIATEVFGVPWIQFADEGVPGAWNIVVLPLSGIVCRKMTRVDLNWRKLPLYGDVVEKDESGKDKKTKTFLDFRDGSAEIRAQLSIRIGTYGAGLTFQEALANPVKREELRKDVFNYIYAYNGSTEERILELADNFLREPLEDCTLAEVGGWKDGLARCVAVGNASHLESLIGKADGLSQAEWDNLNESAKETQKAMFAMGMMVNPVQGLTITDIVRTTEQRKALDLRYIAEQEARAHEKYGEGTRSALLAISKKVSAEEAVKTGLEEGAGLTEDAESLYRFRKGVEAIEKAGGVTLVAHDITGATLMLDATNKGNKGKKRGG